MSSHPQIPRSLNADLNQIIEGQIYTFWLPSCTWREHKNLITYYAPNIKRNDHHLIPPSPISQGVNIFNEKNSTLLAIREPALLENEQLERVFSGYFTYDFDKNVWEKTGEFNDLASKTLIRRREQALRILKNQSAA